MAETSIDPSTSKSSFSPLLGGLLILGLSLLLGMGIYFGHQVDPYIQAVLTAPGDPTKGNEIFEINCAGCHGTYATGNVGPSLENVSHRKSDGMLIRQVISGETPPMPKFQPTSQEMADLLSYLKRL